MREALHGLLHEIREDRRASPRNGQEAQDGALGTTFVVIRTLLTAEKRPPDPLGVLTITLKPCKMCSTDVPLSFSVFGI